jgi:hypothetical protein
MTRESERRWFVGEGELIAHCGVFAPGRPGVGLCGLVVARTVTSSSGRIRCTSCAGQDAELEERARAQDRVAAVSIASLDDTAEICDEGSARDRF